MDDTFRERFRNASPQELIDVLNGDVGNPGWVPARASFHAALEEAFLASGLDCSSFIHRGGMRLIRVRIDGNRIVPVAEAPTPAQESSASATTDPAIDLQDEQSVIDALIRSMEWGNDARIRPIVCCMYSCVNLVGTFADAILLKRVSRFLFEVR